MSKKKPDIENVKKILRNGVTATKIAANNHPNSILAKQFYSTSKKLYAKIMDKKNIQANKKDDETISVGTKKSPRIKGE